MSGGIPYLGLLGYVAAGVVAVLLLYGTLKQPDFVAVPRRRRFRQVVVPGMIVSEAVEFLRRPPRGFSLYQVDADHGIVVWEQGPTLFSLGAFYPFYIDPNHQGILITCAIEARTPIIGIAARRRLGRVQRQVIGLLGGYPV
ncbi:hypothetical protein [Zavarzinia sp.]|uniref:hypothetical protein n=1 Tax=Zavarzinia sp. TaxID=2027920 RepID=UPI003BB70D69